MRTPTDSKLKSSGSVAAFRREGAREFAAPLGTARSGRLVFASGAANVTIHADSSLSDLYRARFEGHLPVVQVHEGTVTVRYRVLPLFDWLVYSLREPRARIALNASIPWALEFQGGVSRLVADLRGLRLDSLELGSGASDVALTLPRPSGSVRIRIAGGASGVTVRRPAGVPLRLFVAGGASNLAVDDHYFGSIGGEIRWATPDWQSATGRYEIAIAGGASNVAVASSSVAVDLTNESSREIRRG